MITNIARIVLAEIWRNTEKPNNEKPTISVVIPVYKESPFAVLQTLQSIERQTYQPIEVIVSQDGSSDKMIKQITEAMGYMYIHGKHAGKRRTQKSTALGRGEPPASAASRR
jgi:cellulose synthase/poly-beta-1,6-N-acetylglucosamine synthase-like glycosyltransferase